MQHLIDVGLIYQFIHKYTITVKGGADMKQVIGYLRQSTMKQQSLAAQNKLSSNSHHIQHINFYSDKQSGRKDNRSGIHK